MPETTISTANRVKQWDDKAHMEYIRSNRYKRYMGTNENAIIMLQEDLTKKKGDAITCPLLGALDISGGYNTGSSDLVGNEKALPNDGHQISIGVVRDATIVNVEEEQASPINIRDAGRMALKDLQMRYLRQDIDIALHSIDGVAYGTATEAQKDAWLDNNTDRVLFGSAVANLDQTAPAGGATNDHSGSLANVDNTSDKLTGDVVSLTKRLAQTATNVTGDGIRPYKYGEDMESFVMFVPSLAFRDLRSWMVSNGYWENAMQRAKGNPLFSGPTSIEWDGVIVREIPNLGVLSGVGAGGINVAPCFLCGSQAIGVAWAMRTKTTLRKEDDYGFKYGVGFMELRGIDKMQYGQGGASAKDWAVCTTYVAGVADA
jgi:hypothetical protein